MTALVRQLRLAALDGFVRQFAAITAPTQFGAQGAALVDLLGTRPLIAIRSADDTSARMVPLLSQLADTDFVGATRPREPASDPQSVSLPASIVSVDFDVAVLPVFEPSDPAAIAALTELTGGRAARTLVLIDGVDRLGGADTWTDRGRELCKSYESNAVLRVRCQRFLPVSVDLWTRALAVNESDSRSLTALAMTNADTLRADLASAARFVAGDVGRAGEVRLRQFERMGMVGLRLALAGPLLPRDAEALRHMLLEASGAAAVFQQLQRDLIQTWPAPREFRVLAEVEYLIDQLRAHDRPRAREVADLVRRFKQTSEVMIADALRRWYNVAPAGLRPEDRGDLRRIAEGTSLPERVGADERAGADELLARATEGSERWRTRASNPLAGPAVVTLAEAVAHWYEVVCASVAQTEGLGRL